MENLLRAKGLWKVIKNGVEEPIEGTVLSAEQSEKLEQSRTEDYKVKHYLFRVIDRSIFEQILDRSTTQIVWESLKKNLEAMLESKTSMLNALQREFEVLEMIETETITEYFERVMTVANKMRSNGEDMPDSKIVEKILRTLTTRFTYIVVSIEESQDTKVMSIDELQSSLVVHEQKFKRVKDEQVLASKSRRGRGTTRGRGHNLGHFQYECPSGTKKQIMQN